MGWMSFEKEIGPAANETCAVSSRMRLRSDTAVDLLLVAQIISKIGAGRAHLKSIETEERQYVSYIWQLLSWHTFNNDRQRKISV